MAITEITDKDLWDRFVEESPYGLLFHRWDFLKLIEQHTDYKLLPFGIYRDDDLICIFPLFVRRYMGVKMVFSPPPQTAIPYLGPVMSPAYDALKQQEKEIYMNAIVEDVEQKLEKIRPNFTNIRIAPGFLDTRFIERKGYDIETLYTYTIDLDQPLKNIWNGFGKDCRERIRRFEKLSSRLEESDDLDIFYDQTNQLYQKQGLNMPLIEQAYLRDVMSRFPKNITMYFLINDGAVTDIEGVYAYKKHFKLLWGVSNTGDHGNQEHSTWELIKKAKEDGYEDFEIVGANTKRICSYQVKFNPALKMYFSASKLDRFGYCAQWCYQNLVRRKIL